MAAGTMPFKPWLAFHNFSENTAANDYYQETTLHALAMGADDVLFWNPDCPKCGGGGVVTSAADNKLMNDMLAEATQASEAPRVLGLRLPPEQQGSPAAPLGKP